MGGGGEIFYQRFFSKLFSSLRGPLNPEGGMNADWTTSSAEEELYDDYQIDDYEDLYEDYYDGLDDDDEDTKPAYDDSFGAHRTRFVSPDWEIG